jgi:hypothetical protein
MAKLNSSPLYPVNLSGGGIPVNLVLNKTPEGKFQIARVNKPGGPQEGDFDVLKEFPDEHSTREYARSQVRKDFPGSSDLSSASKRDRIGPGLGHGSAGHNTPESGSDCQR